MLQNYSFYCAWIIKEKPTGRWGGGEVKFTPSPTKIGVKNLYFGAQKLIMRQMLPW